MIRNIALKNLLINTVFKAMSAVNQLVPKNQNKILLYSNEGFRDNIKYLYDYLIENEYFKKYKIICSSNENVNTKHYENVKSVSLVHGILSYFTSAHVYYCFGRIPIRPSDKQITIQMWHGTSFKGFDKSTRQSNTRKNQFFSYVFASSDFFIPIVEKKFAIPRENIAICGHPRTDWMFRNDIKYDLGNFKKRLIWLPTFRKSKELGYIDVDTDRIVPFYGLDELIELDELLKGINTLIIIKLHPLQDFDGAKVELSNIKVLNNKEFVSKGYDLYRLLGQMDALITDYSSVFYDFLLLDRPIGFTEDDLEEYSKNRGFAVENPEAFKPGFRIKSKGDLKQFISAVINEIDDFQEKRAEVNQLANKYKNGNCRRALEISGIEKEAEA